MTSTEQFRYPLSVSLNCESRKVLLTCSCHVHKWRNTYKYGSQTNGTRHWHDWCIDWALKTAGVSSYIEPRDDGAAQTNRQWQYASNIDEYNCQEDNCLSVELFNNVFSKSISVILDILFRFYLYSAGYNKTVFLCNKMILNRLLYPGCTPLFRWIIMSCDNIWFL